MKLCYEENSAVIYLERLLSFVVRDGARDIAERLVRRYGTLDAVVSAPIDELVRIEGLGESCALLLALVASLNSRRVTDAFSLADVPTEEDIKRFFVALYIGVSVETVYLLLLDKSGKPISLEYIGEGTVSASDIYPRKLLEVAIRQGASSCIMVHNHPRANGTPSGDDIAATARIAVLFRNAGLTLLSHYIVAERSISKVPMDPSFFG